jgi:hypothetical protein
MSQSSSRAAQDRGNDHGPCPRALRHGASGPFLQSSVPALSVGIEQRACCPRPAGGDVAGSTPREPARSSPMRRTRVRAAGPPMMLWRKIRARRDFSERDSIRSAFPRWPGFQQRRGGEASKSPFPRQLPWMVDRKDDNRSRYDAPRQRAPRGINCQNALEASSPRRPENGGSSPRAPAACRSRRSLDTQCRRSGRQPSLPAPASKGAPCGALGPARGGSRSARSPPPREALWPSIPNSAGEGRSPWRCGVVSAGRREATVMTAPHVRRASACLDGNVDRPLSWPLWTALLAEYGSRAQLQPAANRPARCLAGAAAGGTTHRTPEAWRRLPSGSACSRSSIRSLPRFSRARRRRTYPPLRHLSESPFVRLRRRAPAWPSSPCSDHLCDPRWPAGVGSPPIRRAKAAARAGRRSIPLPLSRATGAFGFDGRSIKAAGSPYTEVLAQSLALTSTRRTGSCLTRNAGCLRRLVSVIPCQWLQPGYVGGGHARRISRSSSNAGGVRFAGLQREGEAFPLSFYHEQEASEALYLTGESGTVMRWAPVARRPINPWTADPSVGTSTGQRPNTCFACVIVTRQRLTASVHGWRMYHAGEWKIVGQGQAK